MGDVVDMGFHGGHAQQHPHPGAGGLESHVVTVGAARCPGLELDRAFRLGWSFVADWPVSFRQLPVLLQEPPQYIPEYPEVWPAESLMT
jgi:hypothetical protein